MAVMLFAVAGCTLDEDRESDKVDESVEAGLDVAERRTLEKANPTSKEVDAIARASRNIPRATVTPRPLAPDVCDIGNAETDERYNRIVGADQFISDSLLSDLLGGSGSREKPDNAAAWFFNNTGNLIRADLLEYALIAYYDFHAIYPDANLPEWYNSALLDIGTFDEEADAKFEFEQLEESSDYLIEMGDFRYVGDYEGAKAVFNAVKFLSRVVQECGREWIGLTEIQILKLEGHPIPTPVPTPTPTVSELERQAWEARLEQIEEEIEKSQSASDRMDLYNERAEIRKILTDLNQ